MASQATVSLGPSIRCSSLPLSYSALTVSGYIKAAAGGSNHQRVPLREAAMSCRLLLADPDSFSTSSSPYSADYNQVIDGPSTVTLRRSTRSCRAYAAHRQASRAPFGLLPTEARSLHP